MIKRKSSSSSKKRFNLLLLQEGEIYYEDFAASLFTNSRQRVPGRLHFCSHSIIFVPDEVRYAIMYFSFERMLGLQAAVGEGNALPPNHSDDASSVSLSDPFIGLPRLFLPQRAIEQCYAPHSRDSLVQVRCTQITETRKGNKNHPYIFRKRDPTPVIFGLMYVSAREFLDKLESVLSIWRAAYQSKQLDNRSRITEQLQLMYQLSKQDFVFDVTWLEDFREQKMFECNGSKVLPLMEVHGRILVTNERVYFQPFSNIGSKPVKKYSLGDVKRVVKRRHLLRQTGLEIFFSHSSVFFAFPSKETRDHAYITVLKQPALSKMQLNDQVDVTSKWQQGLISNFDYLLYLNFMAGRSFNDITQYPVFPWVIADYSSPELDLSNPSTFRELGKPIGALNQKRLQRMRARYAEMPPPKFLYGTHYSTPGYVLFFLLRTAPEYMLRLQSGRFDEPDRMFHSVKETWSSCLENDADVKELIPEFYQSTGDWLLNLEQLDLGVRHNGKKVNHVLLPKWAKDEKDFVYKSRLALESEYVSKHINEWIDLIFGCKQNGEEAVKADNLFYYLTYEGAIDIERVKDPVERAAVEAQIREFGQTPTQLFTSPHPRRLVYNTTSRPSFESVVSSNVLSMDSIFQKIQASPSSSSPSTPQSPSSSSSVSVDSFDSNLLRRTAASNSAQQASLSRLDSFGVSSTSRSIASQQGTAASSPVPATEGASSLSDLDDVLSRFSLGGPSVDISATKKSGDALDEIASVGTSSTASAVSTPAPASSDNDVPFFGGRNIPTKGEFSRMQKKYSQSLHRDIVSALVLSEQDDRVFSVSHDASARLFTLSSQRMLRRVSELGDMALSSCVMLNSDTFVVSSWNNLIYVYRAEYGKIMQTLTGHEDAVSKISLHSGTGKLISGSWDATVKLWQLDDNSPSAVKRPIQSFSEHETEVQSVAIEPTKGNLAVSGSSDGDLVVYDIRSSKAISHFTPHFDAVTDVSFVGEKTIVSCSKDSSIKVCQVDGTELHSLQADEPVKCVLTDGRLILTGGGESSGVVRLWQADTGQSLHKAVVHAQPVTAMTLSTNAKTLLTGSKDGEVALFSL